MKNVKTITFVALCSLFLSACNSSSDSYNPSPLQASLIDAPVEGVEYILGEKSGFTDKNGSFNYSSSDRRVAFEVGGVFLGSFNLAKLHSDKKILITDMVGVDRDDSTNPKVVRLLRFLQSLDDDNNPENGIKITAEVREGLENSSLNFTRENIKTSRIEKRLNKVGKEIIAEASAIAHFEKTLNRDFGYAKNTQAPVFYSKNIYTIKETETFVTDLKVLEAQSFTLSLSGADASSFSLDETKLSLSSRADFATKSIYNVDVIATNEKQKTTTHKIAVRIADTNTYDSDMDFIPDDIESYLGMDPYNSDENNNGILDGLESNATFGDQFFDKQWHLRSLGTIVNETDIKTIVGNDLDVLDVYHKYMGYNKGNPIIVQVVDTGVFAAHDDLKDNMDLSRSYKGGEIGDPTPEEPGASHGTQVAGIIAARGFNQIGVRGIAPFAKIAGSDFIIADQSPELIEKVWLEDKGTANEIAISNNSWGMEYGHELYYEEIMKVGAEELRDKKGRIYVVAGGNDREEKSDTNLNYMTSNRFAIVVAAVKGDNTIANYSSPGSSILVSGYAGEFYNDSTTIATTFSPGESRNEGSVNKKTTWSEDVKKDYTFAMNGTSAAAPVVSGSLALVLEACPDMTWRDVQYSIAKNAKMIDKENPSWVKNSAGLYHSRDYGYGLINPNDMIRECTSSGYTLLGAEKNTTVEISPDKLIPDDSSITEEFSLNVDADMFVEQVEVVIDNNSTFASDYEVSLISPSGTKTLLIFKRSIASKFNPPWMEGGHRLSSRAFIDEKSSGEWKVQITDKELGDIGYVENIVLNIYGH